MLPRTHHNGPSIMPRAPKAPQQRRPRSSSASAAYQPPLTPLHTVLINAAIIRNQPNARRITANLVSDRTFFTHFAPTAHPLPRNLLPASPKLLTSVVLGMQAVDSAEWVCRWG